MDNKPRYRYDWKSGEWLRLLTIEGVSPKSLFTGEDIRKAFDVPPDAPDNGIYGTHECVPTPDETFWPVTIIGIASVAALICYLVLQ